MIDIQLPLPDIMLLKWSTILFFIHLAVFRFVCNTISSTSRFNELALALQLKNKQCGNKCDSQRNQPSNTRQFISVYIEAMFCIKSFSYPSTQMHTMNKSQRLSIQGIQTCSKRWARSWATTAALTRHLNSSLEMLLPHLPDKPHFFT